MAFRAKAATVALAESRSMCPSDARRNDEAAVYSYCTVTNEQNQKAGLGGRGFERKKKQDQNSVAWIIGRQICNAALYSK